MKIESRTLMYAVIWSFLSSLYAIQLNTSKFAAIAGSDINEDTLISNSELSEVNRQASNSQSVVTINSAVNSSTNTVSNVNSISKNPFILNSRSSVGKNKQGLMTSSGAFITCELENKVASIKKWFLHFSELEIQPISEDSSEETITVAIMSSLFGCYIEVVPYNENTKTPPLKCQSKTISNSSKITFKKFSEGYFILTESKKYISFEEEPIYTNDFLGGALLYPPFKMPENTSTIGVLNESYCRNLDCDRIVLKFKACNSFLSMNAKSSTIPEYFMMQAYKDNYINLSVGSNYITITPSKSLSFEVQAATFFSLLKIVKLNNNEISLVGYGGKYLECKDGLIYLSDGLSLYSKITSIAESAPNK